MALAIVSEEKIVLYFKCNQLFNVIKIIMFDKIFTSFRVISEIWITEHFKWHWPENNISIL